MLRPIRRQPSTLRSTAPVPTRSAARSPARSTTGGSAQPSRIPLGQTLFLAVATALGSLSIDLYLPAFPELAAELHTGEAKVQLTLTACVVGIALGQLVAGPLSDMVGRRTPIVVGLLGWSAASFACAAAPSITTFTLLRLVQGLAGSAGVVVARAVVRDRADGDELVVAFARLMLVVGVVPIAAPTVGGLLLDHMSWRGLFVVLGVLGAVFAALVFVGLQETLPHERRSAAGLRSAVSGYGVLLRDRRYVVASLVVALTFAALFIYVSSSSFVLRQVFSLTPGQFGLLFGANSCGLVLGNQVSGRLVQRWPRPVLRARAIALAVCAAAAMLALGAAGLFGVWGVAVPLFVMVLAIGSAMPVASGRAMDAHPERAGAASALLGVFQFSVGGALAPLVGALGADSVVPLGLFVCGTLLASLLLFTLTTHGERRALRSAAAVA